MKMINSKFAAIATLAALAPMFDPISRTFDLALVPRGMSNDVAADDPKAIVEDIKRTFETFKTENNRRDTEIEKYGKASNAVTTSVENLNAKITDLQGKLEKATKHNEDVEAKVNRLVSLGGGPGGGNELDVKNHLVLGALAGQEVTAEQYRGYSNAMSKYLRKGVEAIGADMRNALSVGAETSGGYWVLPATTGAMVAKVYETSPMRDLANVVTISTDALEGPIDNDQAASGGWVTERTAPSTTNTPKVGKYRIDVHTQYAEPKVTQQLLDDAAFQVESWLSAKTADILARTETTAFFTGNGSGKPRGILDYTINSTADATRAWDAMEYVPTGASAAFAASGPADCLIDLVYKLKNAYRSGAAFVAARVTYAAIRKLKDSNGQYLWQPSIAVGQPATLLNFGAVEAEDMPAIAAGSNSIAFGNFKAAYTIVDRAGISVLRDPYTAKPYVKFYTTKRVGGGLVNGEAVKFLKFAAS